MYSNQYMKPGLFSRSGLGKGINWSSILDNTQKTLGVINQALPIIHQVGPIISNAKTMFRIADEIRSPSVNNINSNSNIKKETNKETVSNTSNKPIFYI